MDIRYLTATEMAEVETPALIRHYELHTALTEALMAQIGKWEEETEAEPVADVLKPAVDELLGKAKAALRRSAQQAKMAYQNLTNRGVDVT